MWSGGHAHFNNDDSGQNWANSTVSTAENNTAYEEKFMTHEGENIIHVATADVSKHWLSGQKHKSGTPNAQYQAWIASYS